MILCMYVLICLFRKRCRLGEKKKSKMSLRRKIQSGQHWDRMSESDVIGELWTVSSAVNFRSNVERLSNYSDRLDEKILPTISDVTYDDLNRDLAQVKTKISIRESAIICVINMRYLYKKKKNQNSSSFRDGERTKNVFNRDP